MFIGFLHLHKLVVTLFLVHYIIKLVLLLSNQTKLDNYAKKTKVIEMIISFLFLATGIGLWIMGDGEMTGKFYGKLAMVFASIPLAIIGFKKSKKPLAIVSVILIIGAYGMAEMAKKDKAKATAAESAGIIDGKALYTTNCATCHGAKGDAGISGAKDLTVSELTKEQRIAIITNGKGNMTAYGDLLSAEQIEAIAEYIETLKK